MNIINDTAFILADILRKGIKPEELSMRRNYTIFLLLSYAYYHHDVSYVTDYEYDALANYLLNNYETFSNDETVAHKELVSNESLSSGSAYDISEDKYPVMIVNVFNHIHNTGLINQL